MSAALLAVALTPAQIRALLWAAKLRGEDADSFREIRVLERASAALRRALEANVRVRS